LPAKILYAFLISAMCAVCYILPPHYLIFSILLFPLSWVQMFLSAFCSQTLSVCVLPFRWKTKFQAYTDQQVKSQFLYILIFMFLNRRW
jgi:hypothetical protein